jgi:hypothetical protein
MSAANSFLNIWGPALLVCFTVVVGLFYQNTRMNDLKDAMNGRFEDMGKRFDDMKDYMKSEFKRVDERIDRIDSGLIRK